MQYSLSALFLATLGVAFTLFYWQVLDEMPNPVWYNKLLVLGCLWVMVAFVGDAVWCWWKCKHKK